jgi:hypothetical protein
LKLFEQAPPEKRDEDFYNNFRQGCEILQNNRRIAEIDAECMKKFPRGRLAQFKRLEAARALQKDDPVQAAALYAAYLKDFDENISWTQPAAVNRSASSATTRTNSTYAFSPAPAKRPNTAANNTSQNLAIPRPTSAR